MNWYLISVGAGILLCCSIPFIAERHNIKTPGIIVKNWQGWYSALLGALIGFSALIYSIQSSYLRQSREIMNCRTLEEEALFAGVVEERLGKLIQLYEGYNETSDEGVIETTKSSIFHYTEQVLETGKIASNFIYPFEDNDPNFIVERYWQLLVQNMESLLEVERDSKLPTARGRQIVTMVNSDIDYIRPIMQKDFRDNCVYRFGGTLEAPTFLRMQVPWGN